MAWIVIRVRGTLHARRDITETLRYLHLTRPNHATVIPESPDYRGMLYTVQGYVTWGEADPETVSWLLKERGIATDGSRLAASENGPAPPLDELARTAITDGLDSVPGVRPLFRLKAPKGGWRSTKMPFRQGGALGYRGPTVNDLARRMG
ncbi:MAG: uL30 family ribosomal protein [Candidatus Thermoplasmatota archaeon]|nr:uL30 family ribosomal protein [Candidatus Thermoplasmatota archaeon]